MAWLDMHLHSIYSDDGEYTPLELLTICQQEGVRTAAIADHNTTRGIADARLSAKAMGLTLIPAVELDCCFCQVNLHLLGYWIDETFPGFQTVEEAILQQERTTAFERLRLVKAAGIPLDSAEILHRSKDGVVTGEMIAEAALSDPSNIDNPLLLPYRSGGSRGDNPFVNFYWDYCAQGKSAYVPIRYISLSEAISLVLNAGGIPVLAHPGSNIGSDAALLRAIIQEGVEGIEVFSSYHTPAQTDFFLQKAVELETAVSCGSDFHGKTKPSIRAGSVDCGGREDELLAGLIRKGILRVLKN